MAVLPSSLALANVADGSLIVAADHRNNYSAIQTEANGLLTILAAGTAGDVFTGVGTTVQYAKPPGYEYSYVEYTANVAITATTEATANTIVTAAAITFDGATPVRVEFYSPYLARGTNFARLYLYDGASSIGFIGHTDAATGVPCLVSRRLTPSAAAHTFSIRGSVDAGTGGAQGGAGGVGAYLPGFIRVTKI